MILRRYQDRAISEADVKRLLRRLRRGMDSKTYLYYEEVANVFKIAMDGLASLPTLDQETIVYCKNCVKHGTMECPMRYNRYIITDDDFVEEGADTDNSHPNGWCYKGVGRVSR